LNLITKKERTMGSIKIKGMSCQHCVGSVKEALEKIEGIENVVVDLDSGVAKFDGITVPENLENAITAIGFEVDSE
jgi:copper chaperone